MIIREYPGPPVDAVRNTGPAGLSTGMSEYQATVECVLLSFGSSQILANFCVYLWQLGKIVARV